MLVVVLMMLWCYGLWYLSLNVFDLCLQEVSCDDAIATQLRENAQAATEQRIGLTIALKRDHQQRVEELEHDHEQELTTLSEQNAREVSAMEALWEKSSQLHEQQQEATEQRLETCAQDLSRIRQQAATMGCIILCSVCRMRQQMEIRQLLVRWQLAQAAEIATVCVSHRFQALGFKHIYVRQVAKNQRHCFSKWASIWRTSQLVNKLSLCGKPGASSDTSYPDQLSMLRMETSTGQSLQESWMESLYNTSTSVERFGLDKDLSVAVTPVNDFEAALRRVDEHSAQRQERSRGASISRSVSLSPNASGGMHDELQATFMGMLLNQRVDAECVEAIKDGMGSTTP